MISNLAHFNNGAGIRWACGIQVVERLFPGSVKAVALQDGTGVLVVEPASDQRPDNAIILNADGSLRVRIANPEAQNGAICFGDAYYVESELTLIICFATWQMACVIDGNGSVVRTYETR